MKLRIFLSISILTGVLAGFMNCSKNGFQAVKHESSSSGNSQGPAPQAPLASDGYETADAAGNINAYQDLQFRFKIPGATAGATISASNLPTWLTINTAAGEVSGVPPSPEVIENLTFSVTKLAGAQQSGPYKITVIGDPMKAFQWHLKNTGQSAFARGSGVAGQDLHLDATVRSRILGQNIKIAISDTGFVENHPGLMPNLIANASRNYMNNFDQLKTWLGSSTPNQAVAEDAHGTGVAGLIAERGWLGIGGRGVAPLAKIAGFLFIQAQDQLIASGLLTAAFADQFSGDFDIFNYSWGDFQCGFSEYTQEYRDKLLLAMSAGRGGKGPIYVKAAGNEYVGLLADCYNGVSPNAFYLGNTNFSEETTTPYLITVAATNADGFSASYSTPGSGLWVTAPGGEIGWNQSPNNVEAETEPALVTTDFVGCDSGIKTFSAGRNTFDDGAAPNATCSHMATFNGTSSAAPITAGAIALILSANPNLTWRDVKHILASTSDKVDANIGTTDHPAPALNLAGHVYEQGWVTNAAGYAFHNWYGFGRVNVDKAVAAAQSYVSQLGTFKQTTTGATWKYDSGPLALAVPGGSATGVSRTLTVAENYKIEAIQVRLSASNCVDALGVELTSPAGTKSILMNINSQLLDTAIMSHIFLSNAFYGENSAGVWTLKLIGARANCTATWNNWQLNVMGN